MSFTVLNRTMSAFGVLAWQMISPVPPRGTPILCCGLFNSSTFFSGLSFFTT